ncbi:hypothetical protein UR09_02620 [Candidatus Nitromaritima sp. SCGC AAA799-A02]|nr:hypothetical protein UR09_02620 [Candidatus Nitromaritima sp. SCGC AAA799-A02]KMP11872.1 hypothetical protein UZ36_02840 [Candidatus Nitromaritima sp. SCGC AAA799-C22]
MKISPPLVKAFIIFPVNVMGVIPALILWFTGKFQALTFALGSSVIGGFLVIVGLCLCWVTVSLFTDFGEGTPAPWAPPKKLVVRGIYRHARNPMMTGVWCVLTGESILFGSVPVFIWFLVFLTACLVLIPFWEEPDLEHRFGESYHEYKKHVPRWIPRFTPWEGLSDQNN